MEVLDEVSDPTGCTWSRYDGPLWVEFELGVKMERPSPFDRDFSPLQADQIRLHGVEAFARASAAMRVSVPPSDTGAEMERKVLERCFPKLSRAIDELHERHEDLQSGELAPSDLAEVKTALLSELEGYIRDSWHASARLKRERGVR